MSHKNLLLGFTLISPLFLHSQEPENFGIVTQEELNMTIYEKDTTANAVVLYERGENYFKVINRRIRLIKKYHGKIKLLNEKAFKHGTTH
jgi:3-dehydroquinate dehydratase